MTKEIPAGKNHPMSHSALAYVKEFILMNPKQVFMLKESLASNVIEGNETAEYCLGTLERIMEGKGVGERYVFGLAWFIREHYEVEND